MLAPLWYSLQLTSVGPMRTATVLDETTIHMSNSVQRQVQEGLREQSEVLVACLLFVSCAAIFICAATRACPSGRVHSVAPVA